MSARRGTPPRRRAFTLVEAAVSTAVVAVLLVASLETIGSAARARAAHADLRVASALAHDLMSEILASRFNEPCSAPLFGREAGELAGLRGNWDDVDDYHMLSDSPPKYRDGSPIPGAAGWRRDVRVQVLVSTVPGLRRITVTVTSPTGRRYVVVALRSQVGMHNLPPAGTATILTHASVRIESPGARPVISGTDLPNRVQAP